MCGFHVSHLPPIKIFLYMCVQCAGAASSTEVCYVIFKHILLKNPTEYKFMDFPTRTFVKKNETQLSENRRTSRHDVLYKHTTAHFFHYCIF